MQRPAATSTSTEVPRGIRIFVWTFLALFFVAGFARIEAWPLTGWRLFSRVRHPIQQSWQVVTADASGAEHSLPIAKLGQSYRGTTHVLDEFASLSRGRQLAACDAWRTGSQRSGIPVREVRIYRLTTDVSKRSGDRAVPPERTLRFVCRGGTVEQVP